MILCPSGHRHGLPITDADCWLGEDVVREVPVTRREYDVARELLRDGGTNVQIARKLYLSEDTVKTHVKSLFRRTGAATRTELIVAVFRGRLRMIPADVAASVMYSASTERVMEVV